MRRHELIVRPSQEHRKAFAVWASRNGLRTVSSMEFGVPAHLIEGIPGELAEGMLVDGRPIEQPPPAEEPPAVGESTVAPPEPPDAADSPDDVAAAADIEPVAEPADGEVPCPVCDRTFATEHGLRIHTARAHNDSQEP